MTADDTFKDKLNALFDSSGCIETSVFAGILGVSDRRLANWMTGRSIPNTRRERKTLSIRIHHLFGVHPLFSKKQLPLPAELHARYKYWGNELIHRVQAHRWEVHLYASNEAWQMKGARLFHGSYADFLVACPECGRPHRFFDSEAGTFCPVCGHSASQTKISGIRKEAYVLVKNNKTLPIFRFFGLSKDDRDWQLKPYKP
jgi:hypothetical protein